MSLAHFDTCPQMMDIYMMIDALSFNLDPDSRGKSLAARRTAVEAVLNLLYETGQNDLEAGYKQVMGMYQEHGIDRLMLLFHNFNVPLDYMMQQQRLENPPEPGVVLLSLIHI